MPFHPLTKAVEEFVESFVKGEEVIASLLAGEGVVHALLELAFDGGKFDVRHRLSWLVRLSVRL